MNWPWLSRISRYAPVIAWCEGLIVLISFTGDIDLVEIYASINGTVLLTKATLFPSGDQEGTFIVPWPP